MAGDGDFLMNGRELEATAVRWRRQDHHRASSSTVAMANIGMHQERE